MSYSNKSNTEQDGQKTTSQIFLLQGKPIFINRVEREITLTYHSWLRQIHQDSRFADRTQTLLGYIDCWTRIRIHRHDKLKMLDKCLSINLCYIEPGDRGEG